MTDRTSRPALLAALVVAAGAACAIPAGASAALHRPADPVVLTGAQLPALIGTAPDRVVAFARSGSAWRQVPVQVDERKAIDLRSAYPAAFTCAPASPCFAPAPTAPTLVYADPGTLVGPDTNPALDGDDEIALMAADTGEPAAGAADPPGVVHGSAVEIRVIDPRDGSSGSVTFFASDGSLDPGAGAPPLVRYTFALSSGGSLATYGFGGGPNPEASSVTTASYSRAFADRWQDPDLSITRGAATGVDILDRSENQLNDTCTRSSRTFADGEGAFLTNRSGPVRAIRAYLGANSGPMTEKQQIFYADREDDTTTLRVHSIPGVRSYLDYSAAAIGMTYRNDANPRGVTIDGIPDTVTPGPLRWETVDGAQGGLTTVWSVDTTIARSLLSSYYRDERSPAVAPCEGDGSYLGASGSMITGTIPDTNGTAPAARLVTRRTMFFDAPGAADGPARLAEVTTPLTVAGPSPSNRFTVRPSARQVRGRLAVVLTLPGPGAVAAVLRSGGVRVGRAALTATRAGRRHLSVRVTSTGVRIARRHRGRLRVRLTVTFTPAGGRPATRHLTRTLVLRRT